MLGGVLLVCVVVVCSSSSSSRGAPAFDAHGLSLAGDPDFLTMTWEEKKILFDSPFKPDGKTPKEKILVANGVFSAPGNKERRDVARASWFRWSSEASHTKFWMMDLYDDATLEALKKEQAEFGDMMILPARTAQGFVERFMTFFNYLLMNFEFDYAFRIDDDNFVCLDRLQKELPFRPKEYYFAGHFHCFASFYRADESGIILSRDMVLFLVELHDRYRLRQGPVTYGGGMVLGSWLSILDLTLFNDVRMIQSVPWRKTVEDIPGGPPEDTCRKLLTRHKTGMEEAVRIYNAGIPEEGYELTPLRTTGRSNINCPHIGNGHFQHICLNHVKFSTEKPHDILTMY